MLDRIFPKQLDNAYQGRSIAKWVFVLLTAMTIARSLIHMIAPDGGAQSIATIPLNTFTRNGEAAVVLIFSLWGLSQLLLGILFVVVLWRYQAFIPFMYCLILIEYTLRIVLGLLKPIETAGTAPGALGNIVIVPLAALMLYLSVKGKHGEGNSQVVP